MSSDDVLLLAFNRGLMSRLGMARLDLKRTALSAQTFVNWMPRVLGSMMLRPGLGYISSTRSHAFSIDIPFVRSTTATALLEMSDSLMRVIVDGVLVTRPSVSSAVTNGTFDSNITNWTDADEAGSTSAWATGGYASLTGTKYNSARLRQQVAVAGADLGVEHALRVVVQRGPIRFRIGSSAGGEQYVADQLLATGTHSIAFTPTGDFHIQIANRYKYAALVSSVVVEGAGVITLPTPWGEDDLRLLRWEQSADVLFVACEGYQQRRIERRSDRSWSVAVYEPNDGPFRTENIDKIRISTDATYGDITLTASDNVFRSDHVGALFRITSVGQFVTESISAQDIFTDEIKVSGVGTPGRRFNIVVSGTWSGTVTVQRSIGEPGSWADVPGLSFTGNTTQTYGDDLADYADLVVYYRIGIKTGDYASGTAVVSLERSGGSITGAVRLTAVASATSASGRVVKELGGTAATEIWAEGAWSDYRGWPSSVALYDGRMCWAGIGGIWHSISDAYDGFDTIETKGDAQPISKQIGRGPVDSTNFLLPLSRLVLGTDGAEWALRSTTFDEPLTPTSWNIKDISTQGSAKVQPVKVDSSGMFVQRGGVRVYELAFDGGRSDYITNDLTDVIPDIGLPEIVMMAVQRQPDTRIHCLRSDGTVAVLVFEKAEEVACWLEVETDGEVESIAVLPGAVEDEVYYIVKRTIDGSTVRYREKWAMESECVGGTANKQADSFLYFDAVGGATISGLDHLEGEEVIVWADGVDMGTETVSGGSITLDASVTEAVVGLGYTAQWKSAKLATLQGLGLTRRKRIAKVGVILADTHAQGLKYGPSFGDLDNLPLVERGKVVDGDYIWTDYDEPSFEFDSEWSADSRVCLQAAAPRPVTVCALVVEMEGHADP
jgi:hypothetical protein